MSDAPRIYVACLAAYNSGQLHGAWISADRSAAEIYSEIRRMLAASPNPSAEEWAIHDYEGFGGLCLRESESIERISATATGIVKYGSAFAAWLLCDSSHDPAKPQTFVNSYRGEWASLREYAKNWAESAELYGAAEKAGSPYVTVAIDTLERNLEFEMHLIPAENGCIYVFDRGG